LAAPQRHPEQPKGAAMPEKEMTPLEALHYALDEERKAYSFYTRQAKRATEQSARKMFEFLAGQEQGHIKLIEEELEKGFYRGM
jgi:rubrerythrin